jgi:Tfp pilus assembly protein PilV
LDVNTTKKQCNDDSGFTLAEVLIAVILSALVILPMLTSFLMGRMSTDVAKHRTQAMNLIRARLEYLNSKGYNYVNQLPSEEQVEYISLDESEGDNALSCTRTTSVTDVDGDNLLEVEVTVTWNERRLGGDKTVSESVMTLMAPTRTFE